MTRSANLGFNLTAQVRAAAGYIAQRCHSGTVEPALSPSPTLTGTLYDQRYVHPIGSRLQLEGQEKSFADLDALLTQTMAFLDSVNAAQFEGKEGAEIVLRPGTPKEKKLNGQALGISQTQKGVIGARGLFCKKINATLAWLGVV